MSNTPHIIMSADFEDISKVLGSDDICVSNGSFTKPSDVIVPQMVAGFKYIEDHVAEDGDAFVVFTNSDKSIRDYHSGMGYVAPALDRLDRIVRPLAAQFNRRVIGGFYNEETPRELFTHLAQNHCVASHFKWGYGLDVGGPVIEGAEEIHHQGGHVFGFPLPSGDKPAAFDVTRRDDQSQIVEIVNLYEADGDRPAYIRSDNSLTF